MLTRFVASLLLSAIASLSALSLSSQSARADCPNEDIICLAPDYQPIIYGGCAIADDLLNAAMCWSWSNFMCLPCPQDIAACNAQTPSECQGNCEPVTSYEYYQRCDETAGTSARAAPMSRTPAVPATALLASTTSPPQQKWVGTITPKGGKPQRVFFYSWSYGEQQHLRIETRGLKIWARDVVRERDLLSFTFYENDEATCELTRTRPGPFVGTCTEPDGGTAQLKMWPQPL